MLSYSNIVSDASFSLATKFWEKALLNSPSNATVLTMTSGTFGKPSSFKVAYYSVIRVQEVYTRNVQI